jgi:hypothetical protein
MKTPMETGESLQNKCSMKAKKTCDILRSKQDFLNTINMRYLQSQEVFELLNKIETLFSMGFEVKDSPHDRAPLSNVIYH